MGSRLTGEGPEKVYAAAGKWVDAALRSDDSLFTPGTPVWTLEVLGELQEKYLEQPDLGNGGFWQRLQVQLEGASAEAYQCMAEALYVHFLFAGSRSMKTETKVMHINTVLGWGNLPTISEFAVQGLANGLGGVGQSFNNHRPWHTGFIIEFVQTWKQQQSNERDRLLGDPYAFKTFLWDTPLTSALLKNNLNTPAMQRWALMHLIFPDTFEAIVAGWHKRRIADAFTHLLTEPTQDIDFQLQQIRGALEPQYPDIGRNHIFYHPPIQNQWRDTRWGRFVKEAREYMDSGKLMEEETNYKMDVAGKLAEARRKLLDDAGDWAKGVIDALNAYGGNPMNWRGAANIKKWCTEHPDVAAGALRELWADGDVLDTSVSQCIRAFSDLFPKHVQSGVGSRMRSISVLLMGLDAAQYPPFMISIFSEAYALTEYEEPAANADEAELYDHALKFLDRFIAEAANRGLSIQNRLDAQSLMWAVWNDRGDGGGIEDLDNWEDEEGDPKPTLASLAAKLFLPEAFLQEIEQLLKEKRQVIFQGPPGTGKTFLAQALAEHLAESNGTVTRIQFHPSYAYEDFVEGFRPKADGQGFDLRKGPLVRAAKQAESVQNANHYLLIDEINRGNLGKLFGELYFLLEYREHTMQLQYSDEPFSLPKNLYIIGTMNTADRSIALVDLALRRRFAFVDFHPDKWPVDRLLRDWLKANAVNMTADMMWVADIVDRANAKLDDRDAAIGPSYFMRKPDLTEADVRRIWKSEVIPYITERLHENNNISEEYDLDKLKSSDPANGVAVSDSQPQTGEDGEQSDAQS